MDGHEWHPQLMYFTTIVYEKGTEKNYCTSVTFNDYMQLTSSNLPDVANIIVPAAALVWSHALTN